MCHSGSDDASRHRATISYAESPFTYGQNNGRRDVCCDVRSVVSLLFSKDMFEDVYGKQASNVSIQRCFEQNIALQVSERYELYSHRLASSVGCSGIRGYPDEPCPISPVEYTKDNLCLLSVL